MKLALQTRGLTRSFGDLTAVDSVDLVVPAGSFYGFLGPNGAGKSTTIKCLTGLLRPSEGEIRILDLDPLKDPVAVKKQTGVVPEDLALFDRLTAAETLAFVGQIHGLDRGTLENRSEELLALMDLSDRSDSLVTDYSHGMKKKLALAVALLPAPRMLFLDEPFEGIDAVASRQIRTLLKSYVARGGSIFLTSPEKFMSANASTVLSTRRPVSSWPMSISSTRVRISSSERSAIMISTVPPETLLMLEAMI